MKYIILLMCVIVGIENNSEAQKQQIQISFGQTYNGSGDTKGFTFATEYNKIFKKKFSWSVSFGGTIDGGTFPLFFEYPIGQINDGSVNYTIAGFQVTSHLAYYFLNSPQHQIYFRLGALLRYQSSSYWDTFNVLYPPLTGLPYPVIVFENTTPPKTLAIGGTTQIGYAYTINKKISIGLLAGFQFDTQGDNISQLSLTLGRRF